MKLKGLILHPEKYFQKEAKPTPPDLNLQRLNKAY